VKKKYHMAMVLKLPLVSALAGWTKVHYDNKDSTTFQAASTVARKFWWKFEFSTTLPEQDGL